jgi:carbamoyl-phosphate synthase large subunit
MKTILITGIGGDIAQSIATILAESRPEFRLVGADMNNRHAGQLFVDELFQVPGASSVDYLDSIKGLIKEHSVDIIIPTSEQELSVFHALIDEFGRDKCITAGVEVIDIGVDKLKTIDFIASLDIPVPWTIKAGSIIPKSFPCIFKSQKGSGSKNVFIVENKEEALFFANKFPDSIFQELLKPDNQEITCAVYRERDGKIAVLQLLRELTGGLTGWAQVINNDKVLEMCEAVATGMNLYGSINIQLRLTDKGPRIFEINPRFSSTVLMRHRIGFCDLLWAVDEAQGLSVKFTDISINQCMVRIQDAKKLGN